LEIDLVIIGENNHLYNFNPANSVLLYTNNRVANMNKLRVLLIFWHLLIAFACTRVLSAHAQGTSPWSPAQAIPLYTDIYPPLLVADQNRTVHAFNSESLDEAQVSIIYRQWNADKGWSVPVDILLTSPSTRDALQDVVLDSAGRFHMVFYNGLVNEFGNIMYTRAWASEAGKSQAWSEPVEVATDSASLVSADLALLGDNHITLVYSGDQNGVGIYETHSDDSGDTWTKPVRITPVYNAGIWPIHIQIMFDDQGDLHVVWGVVDESGVGQRVYYTRREADGVTWRTPYLLAAAEGNDYGADWPSIIEHKDQLIVMYMDGTIPNGIPPTRWMRTSQDDGKTWSSPVQPFLQVGEHGTAVLLVDSFDVLHIILANRVGDPPIGGIWHGVWIGDQWGELSLINARSAQAAIDSGSYAEIAAASRPNAVIVQGNVLLSAWWHNIRNPPPAGYSFTRINSPELPIVPLPKPSATPTPTPETMTVQATVSPDFVVSITPVSPVTVAGSGDGPNTTQSIGVPGILLIGLFPALLLTIIVVGTHRLRSWNARK